jgi:hypothetical protein
VKRTIATPPLLMGVESADYPQPLGYHDQDRTDCASRGQREQLA